MREKNLLVLEKTRHIREMHIEPDTSTFARAAIAEAKCAARYAEMYPHWLEQSFAIAQSCAMAEGWLALAKKDAVNPTRHLDVRGYFRTAVANLMLSAWGIPLALQWTVYGVRATGQEGEEHDCLAGSRERESKLGHGGGGGMEAAEAQAAQVWAGEDQVHSAEALGRGAVPEATGGGGAG